MNADKFSPFSHSYPQQKGNRDLFWREKMKTKLTKEEQEIFDSYEKGEWVPVKNL